jgi:hypothetical protein
MGANGMGRHASRLRQPVLVNLHALVGCRDLEAARREPRRVTADAQPCFSSVGWDPSGSAFGGWWEVQRRDKLGQERPRALRWHRERESPIQDVVGVRVAARPHASDRGDVVESGTSLVTATRRVKYLGDKPRGFTVLSERPETG